MTSMTKETQEAYKKQIRTMRREYKTLAAKELAVKYDLTINQINKILRDNKIHKETRLIITN